MIKPNEILMMLHPHLVRLWTGTGGGSFETSLIDPFFHNPVKSN